MAYNDVSCVTYESLKGRAQRGRPYAGTTDTFPLGDRAYSFRHFRVAPEGWLDLYLGNRASVDASLENKEPSGNDYANRALVARIHPDNSFEFMSKRAGMSDLIFYDALIRGARIRQSGKHGGGIMEFGSKNMHPLFFGLRVNLSDLSAHPSTDYITYLPTLKRKEGREYLAQFDEFKRSYHVIFNNLTYDGYKEIAQDVVEEYKSLEPLTQGIGAEEEHVVGVIKDLIDKKRYADAALITMHFTRPYTLLSLCTEQRGAPFGSEFQERNIKNLVSSALNDIDYYFLKHRPELFTFRMYESGSNLPACKWGTTSVLKADHSKVTRI